MPLTIQNSSEAGVAKLAEMKAEEALSFLNAAQKALDELTAMHWYEDIVDLTDEIDTHRDALKEHSKALGNWDGDLAFPDERNFQAVPPAFSVAAE